MNSHENFSRNSEIKTSSNRSFGVVFCVVFGLIALWPLFGGGEVRFWAAGGTAVLAIVTLFFPHRLTPFNQAWTKFGLLLNRFTSPIILGLMFYVILTPNALVLRLLGKDLLRLRKSENADSYWISRVPPGPAPETMKNQF